MGKLPGLLRRKLAETKCSVNYVALEGGKLVANEKESGTGSGDLTREHEAELAQIIYRGYRRHETTHYRAPLILQHLFRIFNSVRNGPLAAGKVFQTEITALRDEGEVTRRQLAFVSEEMAPLVTEIAAGSTAKARRLHQRSGTPAQLFSIALIRYKSFRLNVTLPTSAGVTESLSS